jgi:hypothetical protein
MVSFPARLHECDADMSNSIKSPILFRASTRRHIIHSRETRYGINHEDRSFNTLSTSSGIKEILTLGASYFNSLDTSDSRDTTQRSLKPKFMQMVVLLLLLLLLNNEDLQDIKTFLESN